MLWPPILGLDGKRGRCIRMQDEIGLHRHPALSSGQLCVRTLCVSVVRIDRRGACRESERGRLLTCSIENMHERPSRAYERKDGWVDGQKEERKEGMMMQKDVRTLTCVLPSADSLRAPTSGAYLALLLPYHCLVLALPCPASPCLASLGVTGTAISVLTDAAIARCMSRSWMHTALLK